MNTGRKLNKSERLWIIQLWTIRTDAEIAAICGCKTSKITRMRLRMGLVKFRPGASPVEKDQQLQEEKRLALFADEEEKQVNLEKAMERKMAKAILG